MVFFWLATAVVIFLALKEAKRQSLNKKTLWLFMITTFAGGIIFARLFFVLFWLNKPALDRFLFFFDFTRSGLTSYGAAIGIIIGAWAFTKFKKVNIWKILDVASIGMMLGLAIGRIGCFLAGCCYGKEVGMNIPWAIDYKDALRHPTQLYDMFNGLFVFGFVQWYKRIKRFDGSIFLMNIMLYSFIRTIIEFFRVGPHLGPFTYNQVFYIILCTVAMTMYVKKSNRF